MVITAEMEWIGTPLSVEKNKNKSQRAAKYHDIAAMHFI